MSIALEIPAPSSDIERIPALVAGLRASFARGHTRPLAWRLEQLAALDRLLKENADELVAAIHADFRKPELEGRMTDVSAVRAEIALFRKKLRRWTAPERVGTPLQMMPARSWIVREPLGVALIIAPWNYPVQLTLAPLVAALGAGNAAVLKPSELTPHVSNALAKLVPRYLDPAGVALVEGGVAETSALLAERWDHVFYTGNARVARLVMEAAAKHLTPVTLELGGKSPCLVLDDADLEAAARRIAWGKFINAGQTCVAPDYVLVHESRERELLDHLSAVVRGFYGDDPQRSKDFARIVNEQHHDRVAKLLESGEVVIGGRTDRADCYVEPTILRNVSPDSPAMREEIFGPVLPVLPVPDLDTAIDFVNRGEKPLALYVFTNDREAEEAVLARTSSGGVCVNGTIWQLANPNLGFGGVGESGMGSYHGRAGFETFSHRKPVVRKGLRGEPKLAYPPYTRLKKALFKRLL